MVFVQRRRLALAQALVFAPATLVVEWLAAYVGTLPRELAQEHVGIQTQRKPLAYA